MGTVSADLELDAMKDAADAEILAVHNGLGRYVPLISAFCRSRSVAASRVSKPFHHALGAAGHCMPPAAPRFAEQGVSSFRLTALLFTQYCPTARQYPPVQQPSLLHHAVR